MLWWSYIQQIISESYTLQYFRGAIYSSSHVVISNCTVSDNTGATIGGAVYSTSSVTVTNSCVSGNTANHHGGVIYSQNSVTISHTTLSDNRASTLERGAIIVGLN